MDPYWINHSTIACPGTSAHSADGQGTTGDGFVEIHQGDDGFERWATYLTEQLELARPPDAS